MHKPLAVGAATALFLCSCQFAFAAGAPAILDKAKEILHEERPNMDRRDPETKTFLNIVVLVPREISSADLISLGKYYRDQFKSRWQVEVDFWDSEEAFRREKSQEIYDAARVSEAQFLENASHQRARYRKNPKLREHTITLFRKPKGIRDNPVAKIIKL